MSHHDLNDVDQELMRSLDWMLQNPIEGVIEQDFTYEYEAFGQRYTIKLGDPEENLGDVNDSNKRQYVKRLIHWKLEKEIEPQLKAFKEGLYSYLDPKHLEKFQASEFERLISGEAKIDYLDMKRHAKYHGYDSESPQIKWFWEVVSTFDQETLAALWFFATGMSKVGVDGFATKPLKIEKDSSSHESLPKGHTCFAQIDLPEYDTKEMLGEKLLLAILEGKEGFAFG